MKKFLPYILVGAVIGNLLFVLTPLTVNAGVISVAASAYWKMVGVSFKTLTSQFMPGAGLLIDAVQGGSGTATIGAIIGWVWKALTQLLFSILDILLRMASKLLDLVIESTVNGDYLNLNGINVGWQVSRDVANLFFIFILLYISIATILQISSYGMKALLVRLVLIALLVNFSLVVTRIIIDASNILGGEFYNKIAISTTAPAEWSGVSQGGTIEVRSPSLAFAKALGLPTIFSTKGFELLTSGDGKSNFKVGMVYFGGSIVLLIVTFIFFAAAILLIIRTAFLAILMVLAPLAFLFMILPKTREYANQWWNNLFKQSFFFPAFMFMIYIAIQIMSGADFAKLTNMQDPANSFAAAFMGDPNAFGIILNFAIIIIFLILSLVVAKQMGTWGAETMMKWGTSARKAGQNFVGRHTVGKASRAVAQSKTMQAMVGRFPVIGGAIQRGFQRGAKVGGLDKVTEAKVNTGMNLPPEARAEYMRHASRVVAEEMFKKMSARERVEAKEKGGPNFKGLYDLLSKKLSAEEREKTNKTEKEVERKASVRNLTIDQTNVTNQDFKNAIAVAKPDEMADIHESIANDPSKILDILAVISDAHLKKIEDRGDELTEKVINALYALDPTLTKNAVNIANELRQMGNTRLARVIETGPVRGRLGLT